MALSDVDHDGDLDLVLPVQRARSAPSPALDQRMRALCKRASPSAPSALPPAVKTELLFLNDGEKLAPTTSTERTLARWKSESPEGLHSLEEVAPADAP